MNLNMDIIYENLKQTMDVSRAGRNQSDLTLRHVVIYDPGIPLRADCLYLISASALAERELDCRNVSFVCFGGRISPTSTRSGNMFLVLEEQNYLTEVFSALQEIFFKYEAWDDAMQYILNTDSDIEPMVAASIEIFENPIKIIDSNLHILVETVSMGSIPGRPQMQTARPRVPVPIDQTLEFKDLYISDRLRTEPYFNPDDCYNVNLFLHNTYVGVVSLTGSQRPLSNGDFALFKHFAGYIEAALRRQLRSPAYPVVTLKTVFADLLNHRFVQLSKFHYALGSKAAEPFVCIKIKPFNESYGLPIEYLCDELEAMLPGAIALEYDSLVILFIRLNACMETLDQILDRLEQFLVGIKSKAGVSNVFTDALNARFYFRQACCAFEVGGDLNPDRNYYRFSDYALSYMLANCTGELPVRFVCPSGLLQLYSQHRESSVDYWLTLKTYLDNDMNATQAARELYLHRSTLLQRLAKINEILDVNLRDPETRIYIHLCIYLLEMKFSPEAG